MECIIGFKFQQIDLLGKGKISHNCPQSSESLINMKGSMFNSGNPCKDPRKVNKSQAHSHSCPRNNLQGMYLYMNNQSNNIRMSIQDNFQRKSNRLCRKLSKPGTPSRYYFHSSHQCREKRNHYHEDSCQHKTGNWWKS